MKKYNAMIGDLLTEIFKHGMDHWDYYNQLRHALDVAQINGQKVRGGTRKFQEEIRMQLEKYFSHKGEFIYALKVAAIYDDGLAGISPYDIWDKAEGKTEAGMDYRAAIRAALEEA